MHIISKEKRTNFTARSRRCTFVGYPYKRKQWKTYDMEIGEIFISKDVIFHEDAYPFANDKRKEV